MNWFPENAAKNLSEKHDIKLVSFFLKKLQHMKVESEREVSNLKRTINELQQELAMAKQGTNTSSLQGQNMLHFKTKRLRKNWIITQCICVLQFIITMNIM